MKKYSWHTASIFGMQQHLVDLYHVCSNNASVAKNVSAPGSHVFNTGL